MFIHSPTGEKIAVTKDGKVANTHPWNVKTVTPTKCRDCGGDIRLIMNDNGKWVRCEWKPTYYFDRGKDRLVRSDGTIVNGTISGSGNKVGYKPHAPFCSMFKGAG